MGGGAQADAPVACSLATRRPLLWSMAAKADWAGPPCFSPGTCTAWYSAVPINWQAPAVGNRIAVWLPLASTDSALSFNLVAAFDPTEVRIIFGAEFRQNRRNMQQRRFAAAAIRCAG